jgi:flagellin-like protein
MKFNNENRGQVGIGTLIVFIAMVLVAAIAAGVLVNTAGMLQETAEQTGEDSQAQVSDRLQVISAVSDPVATGPPNTITTVDVMVMRAPGSDNIDLDTVTIQWIGPTAGETYGVDGTTVNVADVSGLGAGNVLDDDGDRARLTIDLSQTSLNGAALQAGQEGRLILTTESGAKASMTVEVPTTAQGGEVIAF